MKLFSLRLTTLKSKLYAIVFASFVVRVVAFVLLPRTPSALGPDEGTYGKVANWTALGKPAIDFPDFGAGLYMSGRSLLLPAAVFNKIGFNPLNSVRLTASLYGLLLVCLIATMILKTAAKEVKFAEFIERNPRVFLSLFLAFILFPSHFAWSILGLRESATQFWTIAVFSLLFLILQLNKKVSFLTACGFLASIILAFSARPQVGWVLGLTLLLYLLFKIRNRIARLLIPITAIGVFFGYTATVALSLEVKETYVARVEFPTSRPSISVASPSKENSQPTKSTKSTPTPTISPTPTTKAENKASRLCNFSGQEVELDDTKYLCESKIEKKTTISLKNPGSAVIDQADAIPIKHENNKVGAASAIETQDCPIASNSRLNIYLCIAYRAPYTTFTFLFRPMLGTDVTSPSSLFAAIENVFWMSSALFVLIMFIRNRRFAFSSALAPSLLFMSIYSVAAGAYEGNMGTAFRHKSLILWVVILLLASTIVATQERKAENKELTS